MFVHPTNTAVILDYKAFLSIKDYFYQHQNITIVIKGDSETYPISEIAIIILSLSLSVEAAAFSFTNLFFPGRFSLLFIAVVLFLPSTILLHQLQEKKLGSISAALSCQAYPH